MRIKTFVNKRNEHKFLEVHEDGYGHRTVVQYISIPEFGVKNKTGDRCLHRWTKSNLESLLEDYNEVKEA